MYYPMYRKMGGKNLEKTSYDSKELLSSFFSYKNANESLNLVQQSYNYLEKYKSNNEISEELKAGLSFLNGISITLHNNIFSDATIHSQSLHNLDEIKNRTLESAINDFSKFLNEKTKNFDNVSYETELKELIKIM